MAGGAPPGAALCRPCASAGPPAGVREARREGGQPRGCFGGGSDIDRPFISAAQLHGGCVPPPSRLFHRLRCICAVAVPSLLMSLEMMPVWRAISAIQVPFAGMTGAMSPYLQGCKLLQGSLVSGIPKSLDPICASRELSKSPSTRQFVSRTHVECLHSGESRPGARKFRQKRCSGRKIAVRSGSSALSVRTSRWETVNPEWTPSRHLAHPGRADPGGAAGHGRGHPARE